MSTPQLRTAKRVRGTPSGKTPSQAEKKRPTAPVSRKCLFGGAHQTRERPERGVISKAVLLLSFCFSVHRSGDKWTCEKDIAFWEQAARHVKWGLITVFFEVVRHESNYKYNELSQFLFFFACIYLLGTACRSRVLCLSKCYTSPKATSTILPSLLARAPAVEAVLHS